MTRMLRMPGILPAFVVSSVGVGIAWNAMNNCVKEKPYLCAARNAELASVFEESTGLKCDDAHSGLGVSLVGSAGLLSTC